MARHLIPLHRGHIVSDPFNFLRQEIDRIFETSTSMQGVTPDFEVKETKEGLSVSVELPGVAEKDVDISLSEDQLIISGEKKSEETKEGATFHISERCFGSFSRSLKLPYKPEEKKISASFKDGVLKIIIPRPTTLKPNVHKIPIQK